MTPQAFVDESKYHHRYLLAAAVIKSGDVCRVRKQVNALRMPKQRRIHFTNESDARRKTILNVMSLNAGSVVTIYDASAHRDPREARDAAMTALVDDLAKAGAELLVIEQDDQAVASDVQIIRERIERAGCQDILRYQHQRAHAEPLLAIPDAVAWSMAKGSKWAGFASGLLSHVVQV